MPLARRKEPGAFLEMGPDQVATDLFGHLQPSEKVAIVTKRAQDAMPYVAALESRQLKVRLVTGQSFVQDFCFLIHSKREMVGVESSTYFAWAAFLSDRSARSN